MAGLFYSFPLSSNWLQTEEDASKKDLKHALQNLYKDKSPLVYRGDEQCGKTLLLFQAAVAYASQDFNVSFISRYPLDKMPLPVHGNIQPDAAGQLKTLTFLYMSKAEELIQHCSSLHTNPVLPDVLVVDDLDFYLSHYQDQGLDVGCALLCANLTDVKSFMQSKGGLGMLLLGCRSTPTQGINHVFSQFDFAVANITALKSAKSYSLVLDRPSQSVTLSYSIEESGLYVQNISLTSSDIPET